MEESVAKNQLRQGNLKRNYNIDLLKFFACLAVIGLHTLRSNLEMDVSALNGALYYLCGFAVPVFFVCSGYFILNKKEITTEYVVKKILSIVRIVFIWSFAITTLVFALKLIFQRNVQDVTLLNYLSQITFMPYLQRGYMWQFWYFGGLGIVYILSPVILKLVDHDKVKRLSLWGVAAAICVIIQIISIIKGRPIQSDVSSLCRIWSWSQYFLMGGGIAYILPIICKKISCNAHFIILSFWSIFIMLYQLFMGYNVFKDPVSCGAYYDSIFEMIWVLMIVTFFLRLSIKNEYVIKLIKITQPLTLGVYIIHPLVNSFIRKFFEVNSLIEAICLFAAVTICTFTVTYIISKITVGKYFIKI